MSKLTDYIKGLPFNKDEDRLSWDEIELLISLLNNGIENWNHDIFQQLPEDTDRKDFLAIMANLYKRIETLEGSYYGLVDAVDKQMDFMRVHPSYQVVNPKFIQTVSIMRDLSDVKKKWYRHKKSKW